MSKNSQSPKEAAEEYVANMDRHQRCLICDYRSEVVALQAYEAAIVSRDAYWLKQLKKLARAPMCFNKQDLIDDIKKLMGV